MSKNYVECAREGARCRLRYVVRGCVTKSLTKPQPHFQVVACSCKRQSMNGVQEAAAEVQGRAGAGEGAGGTGAAEAAAGGK